MVRFLHRTMNFFRLRRHFILFFFAPQKKIQSAYNVGNRKKKKKKKKYSSQCHTWTARNIFRAFRAISGELRADFGRFCAPEFARKRPKSPEMQISGEFGRFFLSENRLGRVLLIFAKNFLYLEIFDVKSVKISNNRKLLYT